MQVDLYCCFTSFLSCMLIYLFIVGSKMKIGYSLQGCWEHCHSDLGFCLLTMQPTVSQFKM